MLDLHGKPGGLHGLRDYLVLQPALLALEDVGRLVRAEPDLEPDLAGAAGQRAEQAQQQRAGP